MVRRVYNAVQMNRSGRDYIGCRDNRVSKANFDAVMLLVPPPVLHNVYRFGRTQLLAEDDTKHDRVK